MATKNIQVRLDEKLKKQVERILNHIGMDVPTAVRMFFKKIVVKGGIPFDAVDESYYLYTPEEMREIKEAYRESFDPKNLIGPFNSAEEMLEDLRGRTNEA